MRQFYVYENVDRLLGKLDDYGATREILEREVGHSLDDLKADEFEDLQEFLADVEKDGKGKAVTMEGQLRACPATVRIRERRQRMR